MDDEEEVICGAAKCTRTYTVPFHKARLTKSGAIRKENIYVISLSYTYSWHLFYALRDEEQGKVVLAEGRVLKRT